jgi:nucleotidyltransferase substrate binding protein (TIGR01987 family)
MENKDIRWQQRFQNYEMALQSLIQIADETGSQDEVIIDAAIKRFEITFDLARKVLQDYLFEQGYLEYKGPKKVIAKSFQDGIIEDGEGWAALHEDRNILSHKYDYGESRIIFQRIITFHIPLFIQLKNKLSNENL